MSGFAAVESGDVTASEALLRKMAGRWVGPEETEDLVGWVLAQVQVRSRDPEVDLEVWLQGLMRRGLHSVERKRGFKPGRGIRAALAHYTPSPAPGPVA